MQLPNKYRLLGLDNSRYCTGWSVVDVESSIPTIVDYGLIDTKKIKQEADTLIYIEDRLNDIIDQFRPDYIAAEAMFVGKNPGTGLVLSHVHGIMILVAGKKKIPITYYSVMTMKSCVLGGIKLKKADNTKKSSDELKDEVAEKVIQTFGADKFVKPYTNDVTDSISACLTFICNNGDPIQKIKKPKSKKTK